MLNLQALGVGLAILYFALSAVAQGFRLHFGVRLGTLLCMWVALFFFAGIGINWTGALIATITVVSSHALLKVCLKAYAKRMAGGNVSSAQKA